MPNTLVSCVYDLAVFLRQGEEDLQPFGHCNVLLQCYTANPCCLSFYAMQQGSPGADCTAILQLQVSWLADDLLRLAVFCIPVLAGKWLALFYSRHFEQRSERPVPLDIDEHPVTWVGSLQVLCRFP